MSPIPIPSFHMVLKLSVQSCALKIGDCWKQVLRNPQSLVLRFELKTSRPLEIQDFEHRPGCYTVCKFATQIWACEGGWVGGVGGGGGWPRMRLYVRRYFAFIKSKLLFAEIIRLQFQPV